MRWSIVTKLDNYKALSLMFCLRYLDALWYIPSCFVILFFIFWVQVLSIPGNVPIKSGTRFISIAGEQKGSHAVSSSTATLETCSYWCEKQSDCKIFFYNYAKTQCNLFNGYSYTHNHGSSENIGTNNFLYMKGKSFCLQILLFLLVNDVQTWTLWLYFCS